MELTERTDIYDINDRTEKIKNRRQHAVIRHAGGLPSSQVVGFSKVCIGGYERISENPARRIQQSVVPHYKRTKYNLKIYNKSDLITKPEKN